MGTSKTSGGGVGTRGARATSLAPLIDVHVVADVLGITIRHVQRLVAEHRIPFLKVGRFVRFDPAELNVWLDEQRVAEHRSTGWPNRPR
jgi:excisionase family DNA binding protein